MTGFQLSLKNTETEQSSREKNTGPKKKKEKKNQCLIDPNTPVPL